MFKIVNDKMENFHRKLMSSKKNIDLQKRIAKNHNISNE